MTAGRACSVSGCVRLHDAKGYCSVHYQRWKANGDPLKTIRKPRGVCSIAGCGRPHAARSWCSVHYYRWQRTGDPGPAGIRSVDPNSTRFVQASSGYVMVKRPGHPRAQRGWVREHVVVIEQALGRLLYPGEEVHHRNGVKDDNRPENLELWVVRQPKGQRPADLVEWAREILSRYGESVDALEATG